MKKQGQVVSARYLRLGRNCARWAATGMNVGNPGRVVAAGRAVIAAGPAATAAFGRRVAHARDTEGDGWFITQSTVMVALELW